MHSYSRRWTRQPQRNCKIDESNQLTLGLRSLIVSSNGYTDLVDSREFTGVAPRQSISEIGTGFAFNGSSTYLTRPDTTPSAYSFAAIVRTSTSSGVRNICSIGAGAAYAGQLRQDNTQLSFYHESAAPRLASEAGVMVAGSSHFIVGTWDGVSTSRLYRNGTLKSSNVNCTSIRSVTALVVGRESNSVQFWSGDISLFAYYGRQLASDEVADLYRNPWQLFKPRRIWVPQSGISGNIYTLSPSGGIAFSGTATAIRTRAQVPTGGPVFAGTAPITFTPAAGSTTYTITPSGGVVFSGTAVARRTRALAPTGGVVLGGTAAQIRTRALVPDGGIDFGGTAPQIRTRISLPVGGVTFSGTAGIIFIPAGGLPASNENRISVGVSRAIRLS